MHAMHFFLCPKYINILKVAHKKMTIFSRSNYTTGGEYKVCRALPTNSGRGVYIHSCHASQSKCVNCKRKRNLWQSKVPSQVLLNHTRIKVILSYVWYLTSGEAFLHGLAAYIADDMLNLISRSLRPYPLVFVQEK